MTRTEKDKKSQDKLPDQLFNYPFSVLIFILFLQLCSHFSHSPIWLILYVIGISFFGLVTYKLIRKPVSTGLRFIVVFVSTSVFILYYKFNFTVDMAASFLVLASSLKLLELRHKKDVVLFSYVMLYLSAISFLFVQSFLHALLQLILILACLYVLLYLNVGSMLSGYKVSWSSLFKAVFLAGPIVLVCFLFFPRIAPLWSIPIKTQSATTGMTDFMSPGDIAELAQSSARAFRVSFSGQAPENKDLYWRGLILDNFDGRSWRASPPPFSYKRFNKIDSGLLYDHGENSYEVMLEPSNQSWVYALESSRASSSNVLLQEAGVFQLKTDAIQSTRYKMTFVKAIIEPALIIPTAKRLKVKERSSTDLYRDLQVPFNSNPRTQEYMNKLLVSFPDKINLLNYLMNNFSRQEYYYSLKPPALGSDIVDEFLFDTKVGFCAHYAGSLAYLLRLAGIPSRVIAGYQGGEYNERSNYYIVHQYDAHAWVEAKLPEIGWVRLDPTAMVAPARILSGLDVAVGDQGRFLENSPLASAALRISALNWLRLRIDEFNYQWQKTVVNYGDQQQRSLIKNILGGIFPDASDLMRVAILLGGGITFFTVSIMLFLWYKQFSGRYSNVEKYYMIWLYFLARFTNLKRATGETPKVFLERVQSSTYPRLAKITEELTMKLEQGQYKI